MPNAEKWRDISAARATRGPACRWPTGRLASGRGRAGPLAFLTLAAGLLPGCITSRGPIPWERWRPTFPDHYDMPLGDKAEILERHLLSHHLAPEGVLIYARPYTPFDPESPDAYTNLADVTIWSGTLAGAFAFKHRVTGDPEDLRLLVRVLEGLAFLHDVTGKPGLLARNISPRRFPMPHGDPDDEWRPAPPPHDDYYYRGDVSKDQYFGVLFGYAATALMLGIDAERGDPEIRKLIARPTGAIADHTWENGLRIVDADGKTTTHGRLRGFFLGVPLGPNAALMLGFQRLAYHLTGEERFLERYRTLIARGYHEATSLIKFEIFGKTNHNNDNMGMMGLYALTNLERDPEIRRVYEANLEKLWRYIRHEGNAFFHLIYASRRPLPDFAREDLVRNLRLFPPDPRVYPLDLRDHPAVEKVRRLDRFGRPQSRTALPVHLRRRGSFVWKNSPFALVHEVPNPGESAVSGVDFLLAYWMARVYLGDIFRGIEGSDDATEGLPPGVEILREEAADDLEPPSG